MNPIPNQREQFDLNMNDYLLNGAQMLKEKNIIQ